MRGDHPRAISRTVMLTKSDSDAIFCLQLLSKPLTCTVRFKESGTLVPLQNEGFTSQNKSYDVCLYHI